MSLSRIFKRLVSTNTIFSSSLPKLTGKQLKSLTTTELLIKLGFIRQPHAGITHWLPLGLATLENLEEVIKQRLSEGQVLETSLSSLSHSSLWHKTKRWQNDELYKLNEDFCLAATAEEEITELVKVYADTYKKLPVLIYQMERKYRDERRPRGGLLRGREFIMNDAYSFDVDKEGALASFNKMNKIYFQIFSDMRVPFVKANADSGTIGGDLSYEWHFISDKGEDTLYTCDNCQVTGNVEKVKPFIDENADAVDKAAVTYALTTDNDLVAFYYPEGRHLNTKFFDAEDIVELNTKITDQEKVLEIFESENPDGLKNIVRVVDLAVKPRTEMPDMPVPFSKSRMSTFEGIGLTEAQEGDLCSNCGGKGHLHASKGIEVGHTFYLGKKYSIPLEATFADKDGEKQNYEMGCYGIGVSRLLGAIAEVLRDEKGLRWPAIIAPLQVSIVMSPAFEGDHQKVQSLIDLLTKAGIRVEEDSSDLSLGMKLNRSKLLGIPLQIIIGKAFPKLEIEVRGKLFGKKGYEVIESKRSDWGIETEKRHGVVKHLVDIEHADETIKLLLQDL
ncbi:DEKNAAC100010 [Brettanomyces naardenensis]|uniref:proline--tRNA ligase n=1 Tax=Brettanomyces naardenensis TaxID=13370 RepID=A0A448YEW3_BRENA|nr:DEKNAAC100010 [Brettanomyces naardenensis]